MIKQRLGAVLFSLAVLAGATASLAPPAAAAVVTYAPVADAYIDSAAPAVNFGTAPGLQADASPVQRLYLKFTVAGLTAQVTGAKLRLHVNGAADAGSGFGGTFKSLTNTAWTESGLVWNNRPGIDGPVLGTLNTVSPGGWYEFDVSSLVKGNGTYAMAATSTSADGVRYDSRETGAATAPQLVLTTAGEPPGDEAVLVGAGDIASCTSSGDEATAALLDGIPGTAFTAGDNAYPYATAEDFAGCYGPSWGRHRDRTAPTAGNHEYHNAGAPGYYGYFGAAAGSPGQGWYSYDLGPWHVVALNSNCAAVGGCGAGSPQEQWLRADLAASAEQCTVAVWHHATFTSGAGHGPATETLPLFQALYDADADLLVTAHNHNYERFAPQNPAGAADPARGIRAFVVGTGGASHYGFGTVRPNSEARNGDTYGVLKLTLRDGSYDWRFIPEAGSTYADSGSGQCH
ncbi:DNRLRE domain-containing protein [Streptomyces sp. NPDC051940]|uniref:CBM96 family carbohydrate-binding protein n=1 Tax=Streptomyces sp. NPDC051940 TaxID=3155675 RepID=UPI0034311595